MLITICFVIVFGKCFSSLGYSKHLFRCSEVVEDYLSDLNRLPLRFSVMVGKKTFS